MTASSAAERPYAVLDVDGVLADVGHRLHHLEGPRKDWRAFFAAAGADPPLTTGLALAHELADEHELAYLTGRPEGLRAVTQRWLGRHGLPAGPLWMRRRGDFRPAREMKLDALHRLGTERRVELVVDDDVDVVAALEAAGYAVLQATWAHHSRDGRRALHDAQDVEGRT